MFLLPASGASPAAGGGAAPISLATSAGSTATGALTSAGGASDSAGAANSSPQDITLAAASAHTAVVEVARASVAMHRVVLTWGRIIIQRAVAFRGARPDHFFRLPTPPATTPIATVCGSCNAASRCY